MLEVNRKPNETSVSRKATPLTSQHPQRSAAAVPVRSQSLRDLRNSQSRVPPIVGEVHFKGAIQVDGIVTGQLGSTSGMNVRQRSGGAFVSEPEVIGEISFRDMIRVVGRIGGSVYSTSGTMIVDETARVDANVEVGVAVVNGMVNGDIVAYERVEIGPNAKIYGNIWTRSIEIKNGAIFEGVCSMIAEKRAAI